jgi:hypothetical protein
VANAFNHGIQPAVTDDCGFSVTQVGRVQHHDSITDLIIAGLRAAQVVVADSRISAMASILRAGSRWDSAALSSGCAVWRLQECSCRHEPLQPHRVEGP